MKNFVLLPIFLLLASISSAQPESIWQLLADGSIVRWVYSGGDEFNGTQLDETKWQNSFPWGRNYVGYCAQEYFTDGDNITLENGILKLTARRENIYARGVGYEPDNYLLLDGGPNLRWWNFTSGMIFSKERYRYGLYEIRFKIPEVKGTWPTFWHAGGNLLEEMDIFECKGEIPDKIHWDMHGPTINEGSPNEPGGWVQLTGSLGSGFNNIMGEESPNMSFWYLNGQEFATWLGNNRAFQGHLMATLQIANNDGSGHDCGFEPGPDPSTVFPATYEIDFIRVWTKIDCDQPIVMSNYTQTFADQTVKTGSSISLNGYSLPSDQNLSCLALDNIVVTPNSVLSGNFTAKIISDCPGPTRSNASVFEEDQYGDVSIADTSNLLGIEKPRTLMFTKIFPNPSNGLITIEFDGEINETIIIDLLNSNGVSVFKETIVSKKLDIDISTLPKGVYLLKGTFGDKIVSNSIILE